MVCAHLIRILGKRQIETWKNSWMDFQRFNQGPGGVCTNIWNAPNQKQHVWDGFWPQLWALVYCPVAKTRYNDWEWCVQGAFNLGSAASNAWHTNYLAHTPASWEVLEKGACLCWWKLHILCWKRFCGFWKCWLGEGAEETWNFWFQPSSCLLWRPSKWTEKVLNASKYWWASPLTSFRFCLSWFKAT